ncbi:unnamed protein product [Sphenostylis stenocarpa]|uniref:Cation/H(+) antiporter central domain-containing protein n=1 Tax=Sphenostylis stenocarpa TaxID=92480 RepID=A0AA86SVW9_9FABA|nr:unnamed protein product [Sphenostylis stenocarpa]
MVEKGVAPNVVTCGTFIEIYCKEGNFAEAERFLGNMDKKGVVPNIVAYNTLIDAYSKKEKVKQAHVLKSKMIEKGIMPDVFTYTSLIHGECIVGKVDKALKLFNEMLVKGIRSVKTYTAIICGLSKEGRADEAFKLYDEMLRMGLTPDDRVFAALVGSLHKPGSHVAVKQNEYGEPKIDTPDASSWPNNDILVLGNIYKPRKERWLIHDDTSGTVATYETIHQDIYNVTEEKRASLILLPFHKELNSEGVLETANNAFGDINKNVLQEPPCSVGILVNRGFRPLSKTTMNIIMVFIRGPDDRKALSIAWRIDRITVKKGVCRSRKSWSNGNICCLKMPLGNFFMILNNAIPRSNLEDKELLFSSGQDCEGQLPWHFHYQLRHRSSGKSIELTPETGTLIGE